MKTYLITAFLLLMLASAGCKKEHSPSPQGEMVLNKIFRDNMLEYEYLYGADKKLAQINMYNTATGQLAYYSTFAYDTKGLLQSLTDYKASGKASAISHYLKNSDGNFISSDFKVLTGADSGKITILHAYEYNATGHISKDAWVDPLTGQETSYRLYFYYPNGNLERYESYWVDNASPEKAWEAHYLPAGKRLPESISDNRGYPVNFDLYKLVAEQIKHESFNSVLGPAGEYHDFFTDRVYSEQGFLTSQTQTIQYVQPAKPEEVSKVTYEYIEI